MIKLIVLAAVIVSGKAPKDVVDELRTHVELIGGSNVIFRAEFDSTAVGGNAEGCAWEWTREKTIFRGNARHAVTDFLENGLNVRWPDGETISYTPNPTLTPVKSCGEWVPTLRKRSIRTSFKGSSDERLRRTNVTFRRRMRQGQHEMPAYAHAFPTWWAKYGKEHRDYFAMRADGLRGPTNAKSEDLAGDVAVYMARTGTKLGMCVSSTGLVSQIIANWQAEGTNRYINICENDIPGQNSCHCAACRALDVPPVGDLKAGGQEFWHGDRYVAFGNRVLAAARQIRPDVRVVYYAYNACRDAPQRERVDPATLIGIVPTKFDLETLATYVGGWKRAGMNEFFYRPNRHYYYTTNFLPTGQEEYFFKILQQLIALKAIGFDYDAPAAKPGSFDWFEEYLLYHAMQDPSKSFDYWVDHYCSAYGAAAPEVKAYFQFWREEKWEKVLLPQAEELRTVGRYNNFARGLAWNLADYYSAADFEKAETFLVAAAAKPLAEPQAKALAALRLAHEHAKLYFVAVAQRTAENASRLLAFRRAHGLMEMTHCEGYWGDVTGIKALLEGRPVKGRARDAVVRDATKFSLKGATVVCPDAWVKKPISGWGYKTAQDFTNALYKVTGEKSALLTELAAKNVTGPVIWVGATDAAKKAGIVATSIPKDQAFIRVEANRVFIVGQGEIGPSNGIIEFLQRHADWYFATFDGHDTAPFNPSAAAPVGEYRFEPAFKFRYMLGGGAWKASRKKFLQTDFARRLRVPDVYEKRNPDIPQAQYPGVGITGHSCYFYLWPTGKNGYFATHPEYYSLDKTGKRNATRNRGGQLCLSNPALLDQITTNMLAKIAADRKRYPGEDHPVIYDFTQNDATGYICACENCKKVIAKYNRVPGGNKEGGDAGLQLEFVNELARRVRAVYPDVIVRTFAYVSTEEPPEGIVPEENVMIWLCDLYGMSCHYLPLTHPFNADRLRIFKAWNKIAKHMDVWDYWIYPGWTSGLYPEVHTRSLPADIKLYAEHGLDRIFCEASFDHQCFYELNAFVAAQCLVNPNVDVSHLVKAYCRVYDKAAPDMEEAINFLEDAQAKVPPKTMMEWHQRRLPYRTLETWTAFDAIVKRAYAKAETTPAKQRIAQVIAETARERLRLTIGQANAQNAALEDLKKCSAVELATSPLAPEDLARVKADYEDLIDRSTTNFKDLPAELKDVPLDELRVANRTVSFAKPCWKKIKDPTHGICFRREAEPKRGASAPYGCLLRAPEGRGQRYSLNPTADGEWHWYKLGKGRIEKGSRFFIAPDDYLSFSLGSYYVYCDGLAEDLNVYDIWVSAKFGGNPTDDPSTGLVVDRLLLRRLKGIPTEQHAFPLKGATVVCPDAWVSQPISGWGYRSAQDLTNALYKVTGEKSALLTESAAKNVKGPVIWVGATDAAKKAGIVATSIPKEQARIRVEADRVFIVGQGEIGPSNGIIEFLQRYANYYFVTIDATESAPFNPAASAPFGDFTFKPAFESRYMLGCSQFPDTAKMYLHADFARRIRIPNTVLGNPDVPQSSIASAQTGHSYYFMVSPKDYLKDHSEYYCIDRNGKRNSMRNRGGQLCLTNKELLDEVTKNFLKRIASDRKKYPGDDHPIVYDFTQNDATGYLCLCENCKKVIAKYNRVPGGNKEGGDAGLQLEFVNELARRLRAVYPDVIVRTFAYVSTEEPPEGIVPEENVMIWLCDLYGNSCHYLPLTHPFNANRLRIFKAWKKIAKHMDVWDYNLHLQTDGDAYPESYVRASAADIKLFAENGLTWLFREASFAHQCFFELNAFAAAQLLSHPEAKAADLIRLYCRAYGKAADEMEKAINFLEDIQAAKAPASAREWYGCNLPHRTLANWTKFNEMVKRAYAKADTPGAKCRIAAVLAVTARELMDFTRGKDKEYAVAQADYLRYSEEEFNGFPLAPSDREKLRKKIKDYLELQNISFDDLPAELKGVPRKELIFIDYHFTGYSHGAWKKNETPADGIYFRREYSADPESKPPYTILSRDMAFQNQKELILDPKQDDQWHWYRLGRIYLGKGAKLFFSPNRSYLSFDLGRFYLYCDGLDEDPNTYEFWISARSGKKASQTGTMGTDVNRIILRRTTGN